MKYAILLICFGVAASQFQGFPQPSSPFGPTPSSPFRPITQPPFTPRVTPRPLTPFDPTRSKYNALNDVVIVKQYFDDQGQGAYAWGFQNSDGTERQEKIYFKNAGELGQILVKEGFYTYYDTDSRLVRVSYRADENGFVLLEDTRLVAVA